MAPRNTRREAFEAGFQNPLMGDIGPLQRLYGTVSAMGEELAGGDMGTPFGQKFAERQKATKAEVKRLQSLREKHPEDFGRGMMMAQEQMDPYMLGLGTGTLGAMRPMGATRFEPAYGESPAQRIAGWGPMDRLPAPEAPYYRSVPPEMGTSARPMTPFQQNQVGLATGRYGMEGYAPEMAVTDFETYGPFSREGGREFAGSATGFDRNMYQAWQQGRFNKMRGRPEPMGGEYTPEELGSAITPYRQGGLVYEPVEQQAGPGQMGGPGMAQRLGYERGPIEGEFSDVYGLAGPRTGSAMTAGSRPYGGNMDFGVTREGMARPPSGMMFDPRVAAGAAGLGYLAGRPGEMPEVPRGRFELPPIDIYGQKAATALSGEPPALAARPLAQPEKQKPVAAKAASKGKKPPTPAKRPTDLKVEEPFDPNLNYLVTQALDQLLGGGEAERGRKFQQYYAKNPWPY